MPKRRSKGRTVAKFFTQFFVATIVVTGLWFAGVGFARTPLSRPLGGGESGPSRVFATPKNLKLPGGFTPQPGKTYILGKNGTPRLIEVHTGGVPIDWQAWTSVLRIVLLVAIVAFVLAVIDRGLRNSRRRRVSS